MITLDIFLDRTLVGHLSNDPQTNLFSLDYASSWINNGRSFGLSPQLPMTKPKHQSVEMHSSAVRQFFENLLPEGNGLEAASVLYQVSKSNLAGLLANMGTDMAGALRVQISSPGTRTVINSQASQIRPLSHVELSQRIRDRSQRSFSVWDGKMRMSIAGYQDKIVVFEHAGTWQFVDQGPLASNIIIKPEPDRQEMIGMTGNEFMCMKLSQAMGLPTASVRLEHVPEPVLVINRFDRITAKDGASVKRLHVIDGCQALGLSSAFKYERPYGSEKEVRNIRDGASLPMIFDLMKYCANPLAQRQELLRWVIFQTLIGNTDAHAKNLSFFCGPGGLRLTPTYDLLCAPAFGLANIKDEYAMAIGDAFTTEELSPFEWAEFANLCNLPTQLVSVEIKRLVQKVPGSLETISQLARRELVPQNVILGVNESIRTMSDRLLIMANGIKDVDPEMLSDTTASKVEEPRSSHPKG